jgi:hypothetical protein
VDDLKLFVSHRLDICHWYYAATCPTAGSLTASLEHAIGSINTINIALVTVNNEIYIAVIYGAPTNVAGEAKVKVTSSGDISLVVDDDLNDNLGENPALFNTGGWMGWKWTNGLDGFIFQTTLGATVSLEHNSVIGISNMRFLDGVSTDVITLATNATAINSNLVYIQIPSSLP